MNLKAVIAATVLYLSVGSVSAAAGYVSHCVGGQQDGQACGSDSDCDDVCQGGGNPGALCNSGAWQCAGVCDGTPGQTCMSDSTCGKRCAGGPDNGQSCFSNLTCAAGCVGGVNHGQPCNNVSDCPDACVGGIDDGQQCGSDSDCNDVCFLNHAKSCSSDAQCFGAGNYCWKGYCTNDGVCQSAACQQVDCIEGVCNVGTCGTPPAPVALLEVGKNSPAALVLSWTPVDMDVEGDPELVAHYTVYGIPSLPSIDPWTSLGQPSGTTFVTSATGPDDFFLVTATDMAGSEGPPWQVPAQGLEATFDASVAFHDGEAVVSWTQPPGIVADEYLVYLGTGAASYQFSKELGGTATSAGTLVLPPGHYYVQVVAMVGTNAVARSNIALAKVPYEGIPPGPVSWLELSKSGAEVVLSWTPVTVDAQGNPETASSYDVWSFPPPMSPWTLRDNTSGLTSTRPLSGPTEFYLVAARDAVGNAGPPYQLPPQGSLPIFPLTALLGNSDAEVSWIPPSGVTLDKYVLYWGTGAATYQQSATVGNGTISARAYPLQPGVRYYFQALAMQGNSVVAQSTIASGELEPAGSCVTHGDCDDDIPCTQDTCFEGWCYGIPYDTTASDGLYCTGIETCDPSLLGGIVQGTAPCADAYCNEPLDRCDAAPSDGAVFESFYLPDSRRNGAQGSETVWFNVTNVGSTEWRWDTHALGAVGDTDAFTAEVRVLLPDGLIIPPGGSHTFSVDTTPPTTPGAYATDWQMVRLDPGGAAADAAGMPGSTVTGEPPLALSISGWLNDNANTQDWFVRPEGVPEPPRGMAEQEVQEFSPAQRAMEGFARAFRSASFTGSAKSPYAPAIAGSDGPGGGGQPMGASAGDVFFGEVASQSVQVVNCNNLAELQLWSPDPMEIPKGNWWIYLGGDDMLGGVVGGTNPNVPTLSVAADEEDPDRPLPGLTIFEQYISVGGYETWQVILWASAPGVIGDYELTVSEGTNDTCHYKLPIRILPPTVEAPHVDFYTPGYPQQRYEGVVPRGSRYILEISGSGLLNADVFPGPGGEDQVQLVDVVADRNAQISAQLVVLPTATPGTDFDLVVRNPSGQETYLPILIGEGVWEPEVDGTTGGGGTQAQAGSSESANAPFVRSIALPQNGNRGRFKSLPREEWQLRLEVKSVHMPPGSEGMSPPELPPIYFQDVVARNPKSLRSSSPLSPLGGGGGGETGNGNDGDGLEWGAFESEIDFSISFGFLYRWLVHFDARLFSMAFDLETGEFAPFIQGPPGTQRLLGGISVAVVWAADLTLYGGCTFSTTFGWSCHASLCWSVVSAVDVVGQGYRIARKGCWFDEEWDGESDSGQSHIFVTPGNCSSVTPCVTDENGLCVTEVSIENCCEESLDLITEGQILQSGGTPVIIPFQWTNGYFVGSEPPTPTHGVATVRGVPLSDGSCCGNGTVTGIERCDPPGSLVTTPGGTAVCNAVCGYCTDGIVQSPWEVCDDGNYNDNDACPNSCYFPQNFEQVWVEVRGVLRPDLVQLPPDPLHYDYMSGDNLPLGVAATHGSACRMFSGGYFTVDPAEDILVGTEQRDAVISHGYNTANDSQDRSCKDLFRYWGQNVIPPACSEQVMFDDGLNFTEISTERLGAHHVKINFSGSGRAGCFFLPTFLPPFDYCLSVELRQINNGPVEWKLSGYWDGFPWLNVLVGTNPDNAVSVYEWDVCGKGLTPLALFGPCVDYEIKATSWLAVPGTGGD